MSKLLLLLALLFGGFLAGCAEDNAPPPVDCATDPAQAACNPPAPEEPVSFLQENRSTNILAFGRQEGSVGASIDFNVDHNVTAIFVELAWTDPASVWDLDAKADASFSQVCPFENLTDVCGLPPDYRPMFGEFRNTNGSYGFPDSPSRLSITAEPLREVLAACPDPCKWVVAPYAKDAAADVTWSLNVTIYGGHPVRLDGM